MNILINLKAMCMFSVTTILRGSPIPITSEKPYPVEKLQIYPQRETQLSPQILPLQSLCCVKKKKINLIK